MSEEDEELTRLAECFDRICKHLYKDVLSQPTLLKQLHFLARIFLDCVPAAPNHTELYLNLALLYLLSTPQSGSMATDSVTRLASEAPFAFRRRIKDDFVKAVT